MRKKVFAALLAVCMVVAMLPVSAVAEGETTIPELAAYGFTWDTKTPDTVITIVDEVEYKVPAVDPWGVWAKQTLFWCFKTGIPQGTFLWTKVVLSNENGDTQEWGIWGKGNDAGTTTLLASSFLNINQWDEKPASGITQDAETNMLTDATKITATIYQTKALCDGTATGTAKGDFDAEVTAKTAVQFGEFEIALNADSTTDTIVKNEAPKTLGLTVTEATGTQLGKEVTALQSDLVIGALNTDTKTIAVTGTSHYVTGYTEFSSDPAEQEGNYVALNFASAGGATIKVNNVTLDATGDFIVILDGSNEYKCNVVVTKDVVTENYIVDLTKVDREDKPVVEKEGSADIEVTPDPESGAVVAADDKTAAAVDEAVQKAIDAAKKEDAGVDEASVVANVTLNVPATTNVTVPLGLGAKADQVGTFGVAIGDKHTVTLPNEVLAKDDAKKLVIEDKSETTTVAGKEVTAYFDVTVKDATDNDIAVNGLETPIDLSFKIDTGLTNNPTLGYVDGDKIKAIDESNYVSATGMITGKISHLTEIVVTSEDNIEQDPVIDPDGVTAAWVVDETETNMAGGKLTLTNVEAGKYYTIQVTKGADNKLVFVEQAEATTLEINIQGGTTLEVWEKATAPTRTEMGTKVIDGQPLAAAE